VTYSFVASNPGTFIYESGTDQDVQVRVGLFGALIVRPTTTPGTPGGAVILDHANNRPDSVFTTVSNTHSYVRNDEEFLMLLSEVDPFLNQAVELGKPFNMNNYHPRYWLVNGRGFPDSIADNNAAWLPNQPYGSLARVKEKTFSSPGVAGGLHPNPGLVRYINVGTEDFPFHPHGNNGKVIARDGHPLEASPNGPDLSYEKFSLDIGPGQTWDVLFEWYDAEHYDKVTNPVPVTVPQVANQVFGMFYSGSPYLGDTTGELPPGSQSLNQCGEYYIIAHNHALYQITSWGVNMTGPITYMRIDPSDTTNCP
jgi:FtsP/CotA-like multicopper oxidase with cupredoxin domain